MAELNLPLKTSTQIYYNEYLSTWMTRIWYVETVKGKEEQKTKEVETSKKYIPKPRVSQLWKPEVSEEEFNLELLRKGFSNSMGV